MNVIVFCGLAACDVDIDEGAQAVVLAEVAARVFVASGAVSNVGYGFESNEGCLLAVRPEPQSFLRCADGSGFAAVFVHDDLGLFAVGAEAGFDEVDFGFDDGEIVLRAALKDEACTERCKVRNAGYVEKDVLGSTSASPARISSERQPRR